jgi:hypothetical protein
VSRVAPLTPPWSEEDTAGITSWGHPDRTYEPLLLVRVLQRHPTLAARLRTLGEALYVDALLPPRVRTIAILRICALVTGAAVEWSSDERVLIAAVDELEGSGSWSTATWNTLGDSLSDEQRLELLIAVGWYRTICTLCNGLDLPVEGWMRPWPSAG